VVSDSLSVKIDGTQITTRQFSKNLTEKYSDTDFDYDTMEGEAENFILVAIAWFLNKIFDVFGIELSPEAYNLLKIFVYIIIILFVLYIVIRMLVGTEASSFFNRKSTMVAPLNIQEEHIENIDLDTYIQDAISENNYRLAIRYMYLKTLKQLSLHNYIDWHFDKTNSDYYTEIKNTQLKEGFKKVSYVYDYVWYGEFYLEEKGFNNARKDFEHVNNIVQNAR